MSPNLIPNGIFVICSSLIVLTGWFRWRLRKAVAERHPGASRKIDSMMLSLPRRERAVDRHAHYRRLRDPEIDRHIRNLDRMQILIQCIGLAFSALIGAAAFISVARR